MSGMLHYIGRFENVRGDVTKGWPEDVRDVKLWRMFWRWPGCVTG